MSSSWIPQQAGGSWGGGEPPVGSAAPGPVTSPLTAPMPAAPWSDGPGQDGVAQGAGAPPTWGQPSFYPGTGGGDGGSPVPGVSTLQRLSMQVLAALAGRRLAAHMRLLAAAEQEAQERAAAASAAAAAAGSLLVTL